MKLTSLVAVLFALIIATSAFGQYTPCTPLSNCNPPARTLPTKSSHPHLSQYCIDLITKGYEHHMQFHCNCMVTCAAYLSCEAQHWAMVQTMLNGGCLSPCDDFEYEPELPWPDGLTAEEYKCISVAYYHYLFKIRLWIQHSGCEGLGDQEDVLYQEYLDKIDDCLGLVSAEASIERLDLTNRWLAGDMSADTNRDGELTVADLIAA